MSAYSPLRYPGGKGKLASYLSEIIELNGLDGGHYAEPFAGGAAVALELLFSERVRHIHINDLDTCVYAFWHSAVHETEELIARILEAEISVDTWLEAREIKRNASAHQLIEVGFSTFFLSRTNRSGILNGGVIGGLQQNGAWKIDCRFNKAELVSRIRRIGSFRSRISVTNVDASVFLSECASNLPDRSFLYVDPPYYVKGAYLYQNHLQHQDHVDLAKVVCGANRHGWIVSYDNVAEISQIYCGYDQEQFGINYSARAYARGSEIMIFSNGLKRPNRVYCSEKERRLFAAEIA